jgi:uncharacterized protein (TIGR02246 family)
MRVPLFWLLTLPVLLIHLGTRPVSAADPKDNAAEEALKKRGEAFVAAFDKGDAEEVAKFWTKDGDYVDQGGHHHKGRKAIQEVFQKLFSEHKGLKMGIHVTSLRVVKPDLAIEDGVTEVTPGDGAPATAARYTIVHVKHDGQWMLESVREGEAVAPSNYVYLAPLAWLIGEWVDEVEKGEVARATYTWAENQNFIVSSFATTLKEVPIGGGTQWIAWDAAAKNLRSWAFDSTGGFSEGTWTRDGNKYTIKTVTTTPSGKKVSATNIVTKVDNDHLTWQSVKRSVDGKDIPDTEVVKMKRVVQK